MYHKIMVPLDGSDLAEYAIPQARALALAFKASLHLTTVEEIPEQPAASEWDLTLGDFFDKKRQAIQERLDKLAHPLRSEGLEVTTSILPLGPPVTRLLEEIQQQKADLIVLHSHGRSGISRMIWGSVAERLTRQATCPVMIVHAQKTS